MTRMGAVLIGALCTVGGSFATGGPAQAAEWPWCADIFEGGADGGGTATNCGFISWRQCEEYLSGMKGHCYENPFYERAERPRRRDRRSTGGR
jgi:hypothetical protein